MDEKLKSMLDFRSWEQAFEKFSEKGISYSIRSRFAQPQYRMGLVNMIAAGDYEIQPPRSQLIPKDNGGMREIFILNDLDRAVMSVINEVYYSRYSARIHERCISYQKGLSVPNTLHRIRKLLPCNGYKVDLSKYFDSVPHAVINRILASMDTGSPLDQVLWKFYNDDRVEKDGILVPHFKSLAQGCSFSSLLANLCLASIDEEVGNLCKVYLRYSDDILMLGECADEALALLQERLSSIGLSLNPKKVERISEKPFVFLGGIVCKDWVRMAEKSKKKAKTNVRSITRKYGKAGSRKAQRNVVKQLNRFLYGSSSNKHCFMEYFSFLCTDDVDMIWFDQYVRAEIKAAYTGKHNHTTNEHKTSNDLIREMGYLSPVHMYHLYKWQPQVFRAKLRAFHEAIIEPKSVGSISLQEALQVLRQDTNSILCNLASRMIRIDNNWYRIIPESIPDFYGVLESYWSKARLYEGGCALNTSPDCRKVYSFEEFNAIQFAAKFMMLCIITHSEPLGQYYWQSKQYPDLVLFREWFSDSYSLVDSSKQSIPVLNSSEGSVSIVSAFL